MSAQLKTQAIGLTLALATAIGCIAYERIVRSCSYFTAGLLTSFSYMPFWMLSSFYIAPKENAQPLNKAWVLVYIASGITGPAWYWLTNSKNVLTGAVFEMKYLAVLVVLSILMGDKDVTLNTIIGAVLGLGSIYFISK